MDEASFDPVSLLRLRDRDLRSECLFVAEGRLLVARAIESSLEVLCVVADPASADEARALCGDRIPFRSCLPGELDAIAGFPFHRGMLAVARRPNLQRASPPFEGPVLVLPEITDPGNLGTLLRSALAFGFRSAWIGTRSCDPWNRKCLRASMGAAFSLPLYEAESGDCGLLSNDGFSVLACALEPGALESGPQALSSDATLANRVSGGRVALVLGNEHDGISPEWRRQCASAVMVPVSDAVDSLNVAIAGSILMRDFSPRAPR
jgi:tRNA G18 (ribose-2'-O)-methylase SpoU